MGVESLHDVMEAHLKETNLKDIDCLKGKRVGVDAYGWLFKCKFEMERHKEYRYTDYIEYMYNSLKEIGIDPVLVFDGSVPPIKRKEDQRWPPPPNHANDYDKSDYISAEVVHQVVKNMKHRKINVLVAPYEADAQLAFMAINKYIDAVITEDSDCFPYKCPRVIYKLKVPSMTCNYFEYEWEDERCKFPVYRLKQNYVKIDFRLLTPNMFVQFCILCGTNYLSGIYGIGPANAFELIKDCRDLEQLFVKLKKRYGNSIPISKDKFVDFEHYKSDFKKAIDTYGHQRVYCPRTKKIKFLRDYTSGEDGQYKDYLGAHIEKEKAIKIAEGVNNPNTGDPFPNEERYKVRAVNVENVEHIKKTREKECKDAIPTTSEPTTKKYKFTTLEAAWRGR